MAGPGVIPAVRIGASSSSIGRSDGCTPLALSRRMYSVPRPKTMKYTMMTAIYEVPTAEAARAEALSRVVINPYTV